MVVFYFDKSILATIYFQKNFSQMPFGGIENAFGQNN